MDDTGVKSSTGSLVGLKLYMATISGLPLNFTGVKSLPIGASHTTLPTWIHSHDSYRFNNFHCSIALFPRKIPNPLPLQFIHLHQCSRTTPVLSSIRNYKRDYNDDYGRMDPFWLYIIREAIWTIRSLFVFLVEQPSQLKYIEWPSFQSTLKTATLTLVLVAVLIVALSSVDSALSYLLALLLRRKA